MSNYSLEETAKKVNGEAGGWINTNMFATEGANSISLTQVVPKTLVIHVGNYYDRNGTQRLASDTYNFNASSDTYGLRTVSTISFSDGPAGWFGYHYDSEQAETIESFATCVAAIRYALHNFGSGVYLQLVVHGHVSWHGSYDMQSAQSASIKDANQMDMFSGFALTSGAPGTYSGSDSAYVTYQNVTARVDIDCNGVNTIAPGMWFRGPRCMWSGVNLVFRKTDSGDIGVWWSKSASGFHEARGMRYASIDQPAGGYFYPFHWVEGANGFLSSGSSQPIEFYISRNSTIFTLSGGSDMLTSNNATSNDHYFEGQNANIGVRYSGCSGRSSMLHKFAQVYLKSGSSFDRTINTFGMAGPFNQVGVWDNPNPLHVPGNGTMLRDANAVAHSVYNLSASLSTANLTYTGNPTGGLFSKWGNSAYQSTLTALSPSRLTSNVSFKSKPTARANDPYSDQK